MRNGDRIRRGQAGYTLVAVLVLLALMSYGLAVVGPLWADQAQREREQDLIRVGQAYAQALTAYKANAPGSLKEFPPELEALALDRRYVGTVRWLRKLYPDPMDEKTPWGVVRNERLQVIGVYSQSTRKPLTKSATALADVTLPAPSKYSDWKFLAKETP